VNQKSLTLNFKTIITTPEPSAKELLEMAKKIKQQEMKNGECVGCLGKAYRILTQEKKNTDQ
jgi:hypothetical protein